MPVKLLIRILREREVGQTREYNVDGLIFKVHVFEDTDLWRREIGFTEMEEAKIKNVIWSEAAYIEINSF